MYISTALKILLSYCTRVVAIAQVCLFARYSHTARGTCLLALPVSRRGSVTCAQQVQMSSKVGRRRASESRIATLWPIKVLSVLFDPTLLLSPLCPPAVRDFGAHAGADVQTQDLQPQPQRLPQDLSLPEMAEDGGTAR